LIVSDAVGKLRVACGVDVLASTMNSVFAQALFVSC
jgi:hypothetical protein